ncbi:hypothetical protein BC629DRAFT_767727 [Irpex lacteus]|nr:hypothetical protein BC629DRAFT_767727 [Irpex lacteus]
MLFSITTLDLMWGYVRRKPRCKRQIRTTTSTYTLVSTPSQLRNLVYGRRKAIEWARAHAIHSAYHHADSPEDHNSLRIPLTVGMSSTGSRTKVCSVEERTLDLNWRTRRSISRQRCAPRLNQKMPLRRFLGTVASTPIYIRLLYLLLSTCIRSGKAGACPGLGSQQTFGPALMSNLPNFLLAE